MLNVAIVGAGPAGVYCALCLQDLLPNFKIDIFEKNSPLKTLLPTGGGRCNLTHYGDDFCEFAKNYPRGEKFLYSIFSKHFVFQTLEFFEKIGIKTYMQDDFRYFPISNSAKDMQNKMLSALKSNVKIINKNVTSISELQNYNYIVLSGGSFGAINLAKDFGHKIIEQKPALCGLKLSQNSKKFPQGVVLKLEQGDILFTNDGISGPLIYKISSINAYKNFPYTLEFDLLDTQELQEAVKQNPKKAFGNVLSQFVPKSVAKVLTQNFDTQCAQIKKSEIESLKTIKFEVVSRDNRGEIVHAGGVDLSELNNYCQSKLNKKLFFCGEIMNVDGFCGGFNLQACWSSAFCVAQGIYLTHKKNL